jgi:hypothetical protein
MNKYKQATKHFKIPVLGWEDNIWPEVEMKKWQMVENMLIASMKGAVNAVFREGDMRLTKEKNGSYTVKLSATGNEPSVCGTVGGAYFDAPSSLSWSDLSYGKTYFLYVEGSTKTFQDDHSIVALASTTRLTNQYVTLIAKVDLTDEPLIDRNPVGKVNTRDLSKHVLDNDNPHGDKLIQDEIWIRNRLVIGDENDADIELEVNGTVYNVPVSRIVESLKTRTVFVDFISGGTEGIQIEGLGNVKFAQVIKTNVESGYLGDVSFGFYGDDKTVINQSNIKVFNSGEAGIELRAMLTCEIGG